MRGTVSAGESLKHARLARRITLRETARQAGISPAYLSDIENDRRFPAEAVLERLAALLGLCPDQLGAAAGQIGDRLERFLKMHPEELLALRRRARRAGDASKEESAGTG